MGYIEHYQETLNKVKSNEYFDWLVSFIETLERKGFCDDEFDYSEAISEKDKSNAEILSFFETIVCQKMKEQRVLTYYDEDDFELNYFKLRGNYYSIQTISGQGSFTSVKKLENEPEKTYVFLDEEIPEQEFLDRELIEYIIINKDLNISPAKLAVHVGHACTIVANEFKGSEIYELWYDEGKTQKKILLGAHLNKLEKFEKDFFSVRDLGFTEVEPNTLIAVSLGIMSRKDAKKLIKGLQLYK